MNFKLIDLEYSYLDQVIRSSFFVEVYRTQILRCSVGVVEQQFRGHVLKLAGDRTFELWTVTIINDVEFSSRSV